MATLIMPYICIIHNFTKEGIFCHNFSFKKTCENLKMF
jgi:hypothetical protein